MPSHIVCYGIRPAQLKREKEDATTRRKTEERGARMKTGVPKQHTTAAIWFRFASPKFLLHCVPQKLHIAAERWAQLNGALNK